jgi:hypothetical protein
MKSRWFRWTVRIFLGLVALLGAGLATLFISNPTGTPLLLGILIQSLVGNTKPPEMYKAEIAGTWTKWDEANRHLTARVQQQFPPGTPENTLKSLLLKQGFKPLLPPPADCVKAGEQAPLGRVYVPCPTRDLSKELDYRWSSGICTETIGIIWETDGGNAITRVSAGYHGACL